MGKPRRSALPSPSRGGEGEPWVLPDAAAVPISDVAHVRAVLVASAALRRSMSYSELLEALGHRFSRPRMRAICRTLDAIDEAARAAGEPELAVLVVRRSDGLPGQGWWAAGRPRSLGYEGPWSGPEAAAFVADQQRLAFDRWGGRAEPRAETDPPAA